MGHTAHVASTGALSLCCFLLLLPNAWPDTRPPLADKPLALLPYPQEVHAAPGRLALGPPAAVTDGSQTPTESIALKSARSYLPTAGRAVPLRLGSVEEGFDARWLDDAQLTFIKADTTSPEACVLIVAPDGVTIVGKGRWGMLFGVQTLNQLALQATRNRERSIPCLAIRDWPEMRWRCLSPSMTWYSGWNRLEGYDLNNWTLDEWKWLVDWSLLHKLNCWAVCMYGYWPFTVPGYDESTLQVDSFWFNPKTGRKEPRRFIHLNIRKEFLPELNRYANERGISIYAYIGKNSFNGGYILKHPEANAGGAAEALPFAPGVREYWSACIGRILELGFNGFVFEDPEAYHVPNQNDGCYRTFWEPWAKEYGFHSHEETDANKPPLGVHIEYYGWLFHKFDTMISEDAKRLNRKADVFLISHILLSRIIGESKTREERLKWLNALDERQGRKPSYIVSEFDEAQYVDLLGADRVASLGGRGGSCLCAWRRMTGVNNNMDAYPMGASVTWERDAQRHIHAAGGRGAMAYVFEWRSNEIYGYIGAQTLWRPAGVPSINNDDQIGFLDYAYRVHYGDEVGSLVAQALDMSPCVNDAMVLDDVHGAQYPETGAAYHRDYQLLAAQANEAQRLAWEAYRQWTGHEPSLDAPVYRQASFRWNGYNAEADHQFKAESLRWLCVELRRAKLLCDAALARGRAARLAAEGAPREAVLQALDEAVAAARENQKLYQLNFDDDYDWNEGLCVKLADRFVAMREAIAKDSANPHARVSTALAGSLGEALHIPWTAQTDKVPATPTAREAGLYLSLNVGLADLRDFACHGVVFTVQMREQGAWSAIFRRSVGKNARAFEHWDIPLPVARSGSPRAISLRFLTDSYSRARDRNSASWRWALWGNPKLVQVGAGGEQRVLFDFTAHASEARPFVILDRDGKERPFDRANEDSTGAQFRVVTRGPLFVLKAGEGRDWQWIDGFAASRSAADIHNGVYRNYLGAVQSWWMYGGEKGEVAWETAPAPERRNSAVAFIGGTDYGRGQAELWCNGTRLLGFDTGRRANARWQEGDVELRYYHGAEVHDEKITYGLSGAFVLRLPARLVEPGKPLSLAVRMMPSGGGWFMLHGYRDVVRVADGVVLPAPQMPAICAFTPHDAGAWGVTGADFRVRVSSTGSS